MWKMSLSYYKSLHYSGTYENMTLIWDFNMNLKKQVLKLFRWNVYPKKLNQWAYRSFIKRQTSDLSSDNEWQPVVTSVTRNDNEW